MLRKLTYWIILAMTLIAFPVFADDRDIVCRADALRYDTAADMHFEGIVQAIAYVRGVSISDSCMFVTLSKAGSRTTFYIGPEKYIARNEFKLVVGDNVFITGAAAMDSNNRMIVLTRSIRNDSTLLVLRDEEGQPIWVKSPVVLDPDVSDDPIKEGRFIK